MRKIFLLFSGQSVDGRGEPEYTGVTEDASAALKHFKRCRKSPYATGKVMILTEKEFKVASNESDFSM